MSERQEDIQLLLQKIDLEAAGREIARPLMEWLTNPALLKVLHAIQGTTKQPESVRTSHKPLAQKKAAMSRSGQRVCAPNTTRGFAMPVKGKNLHEPLEGVSESVPRRGATEKSTPGACAERISWSG